MSFNLVDSVKGLFGSDLITKASSMLGESETSVQKAVSGIIPSVLTGILNKAGSGDPGGILSMSKDAFGSGMLSNIGNLLGSGNLLTKGADMLKGLFGERTSDVANMISGFSGVKSTSAASLMSAVVPAALGSLGKHASETNMNSNGLLSFLNNQKNNILGALPSGLNLAGALGLGSLSSIGNRLSGALSGITGAVKDIPGTLPSVEKKKGSWWVFAIVILAIAALLWYLMSGKKDTQQAGPPVSTQDTVIESLPPPTIQTIKVRLPDGIELDAYKGGIEDQLVSFLNDPSKKVDKNTWFDFDNLNFETGSSTITSESMRQLQNIAAILKAFPNAAIKIGGYTDKTGDSLNNLKLSQARAEAVLATLKDRGTKPSQLDGAEGYGSQFAKAAADAPDEERKKDRRIAVSVRRK